MSTKGVGTTHDVILTYICEVKRSGEVTNKWRLTIAAGSLEALPTHR